MAQDWLTVPAFTTGELVRVNKLQDIWTNLYTLAEAALSQQHLPGSNQDTWSIAGVSSAWADIDPDFFHLEFDSYGGDLLITADIHTTYSTTSTTTGLRFRFLLDGVGLGNDSGQFQWVATTNIETTQVNAVAHDVAAGSHVVILQWWNEGSGTGQLWKSEVHKLNVMEF